LFRYFLNAIYIVLLAVLSPWIVWRGYKKGSLLLRPRERWFGSTKELSPLTNTPSIWLHAVSVGEVNLLGPIVRELKQRLPEHRILISATTAAGIELAQRMFPQDRVIRCPLDFTWAIQNVIDRNSVQLIVLAELELWPNWLSIARQLTIPVAIVNGRLSEKSFQGYHKIRPIVQSMFHSLSYVGAQTKDYADRFVALGTPRDNVELTGNIKFDNCELNAFTSSCEEMRKLLGLRVAVESRSYRQCSYSSDEPIPIWVVGSTQAGEEELAIEAFAKLLTSYPSLRMIIVPRHPERCDAVIDLVAKATTKCFRFSEMKRAAQPYDWQVIIGDTVGDLKWMWSVADLAFVGGSFGDRGGQNMIEPAAFGASVAVGPNTKNFAQVVSILLDAQAIVQLRSESQLMEWASNQLKDHASRKSTGQRAQQVIAAQRGAIGKTIQSLERVLASAS
jgi:3-deoxy-D-manno-octulosonic-acid transferase